MNHRLAYVMLGVLAAAALLPTAAQAQLGVGAQTSVADCRAFTTSSVVATVDAGSIVFCSRAESIVSTSAAGWRLGASLTTPRLSGASPTIAITLNALSGCTAGSPTTAGAGAGGSFGGQTSSTWMMTMTGGQCSGYLRGTVTSGGTTVYDGVLDFGVMSADVPNYNVNSGGITVTDDANGWALTGALTIHQDPLSGTITVTNAGGQTVTVSSWPALNAVLSGAATIDIADDTTADGMLTVPVPTDTSFNSTFGNVTFQQASAKEKASAGYNAWAPLILALGILAASVLGARGINYTGVGFAGIIFMFAGIVSWKFTGNWPLGIVLIGFGLYLTILAGGELRDWRARQAEEAGRLAAEASPE